MDKNNLMNMCENIKEWIINVRRDFHKTPELGMEEFITKEKIKKYLKTLNIPYIEYPNHTGILANINTNSKKTIAFRADMDGLEILENTNATYSSIHHGKMHACAHDAHMAILLGLGKILNSIKSELNVNIKLIFQPAEETIGGAKNMIYDGCLENPKVDYIFGLHLMPHIDTGYIEVKYDTLNASTDDISITILGKQSHGAYPHQGVDALLISSHVISSLQSIISRNINPSESAVLTFGSIHGGIKQNILCDNVIIKGTLRCINSTTREFIKKRIGNIVKDTCNAFGGYSIVDIKNGYEPLINYNDMVDIIINNGKYFLGEDKVVMKKSVSLGAEDFSFYLKEVEGAFFHLGCKKENKPQSFLHTSTFDIDENCLILGVGLQVLNALTISNKFKPSN